MIAPPTINRTLRGFLDFFGIKNGGNNPDQVLSAIAPVMDMFQWYAYANATYHSLTRTLVASESAQSFSLVNVVPSLPSASAVQLQVPQTETWLILPGTSVLATLNNVAGQAIEVDLITQDPQSVHFHPVLSGPKVGSNGSATFGSVSSTRTNFQTMFLNPGWFLQGWHYGALIPAGGQADLKVTLRVLRLLI